MIGRILHKKIRGVVIIWAALLMLVLIGFIGMGIDMGMATLVANQMQAGADAAALAGARKVRSNLTQAQLDAQSVAVANHVARKAIHLQLNPDNDPEKDIVVGNYDRATRTFTPQTTDRNAVQVVVRRNSGSVDGPVSLAFGPIFGVDTVNIERRAIAIIGGGTGAGLIALNKTNKDKALWVTGNSTVDVNRGAIQVNSSSVIGMVLGGNFTTNAEAINIHGDWDVNGSSGGLYNSDGVLSNEIVHTGRPQISDPLESLVPPSTAGVPTLTYNKNSSAATLDPGYYPGGLDIKNSVTLNPGIYITNGLSIGSGANVRGTGVMFYVPSGSIKIGSGATVYLREMNTGDYKGILLYQPKSNTADVSISGNASLDMEGTIYLPSAAVTLAGTFKVGSQLIADTIKIQGGSQLTVNYDGRFTAPGNSVFLVH